jgi:ABC-type phosphate/phosphonate transport system ATPase subunit
LRNRSGFVTISNALIHDARVILSDDPLVRVNPKPSLTAALAVSIR